MSLSPCRWRLYFPQHNYTYNEKKQCNMEYNVGHSERQHDDVITLLFPTHFNVVGCLLFKKRCKMYEYIILYMNMFLTPTP